MDISKLVEDMNHDLRAGSARLFGDTVYRDTPIVRVARDLPKREPEEYRQMRRLGVEYDRGMHTESRIFYEQAKLMEQFEDAYAESVPFRSFYPTYRAMSLPQLRTYFTWRTKLRRGELTKTDLSYAFVYVFELLHLVGAESPAAAYEKLLAFYNAYRVFDPLIERYLQDWLRDFVVYYGLPPALLAGVADLSFDAHTAALLHPEQAGPDALFAAMEALSTFHPSNSRFYKDYPDDFRTVCLRVYQGMCAYYAAHRKTSYGESLFGKLRTRHYAIFSSAVFYDKRRFENRSYVLGPLCRYECKDGRWLSAQPAGGGEKSKALGAFFRNVDSYMRQAYAYPFETKPMECTKQFEALVKKEIDGLLKEKKAAEQRVVTIDFSALDRIRAASDATREKILTDEERDAAPAAPPTAEAQISPPGETQGRAIANAPEAAAAPLPAPQESCGLEDCTEDEKEFLRLLLAGADPAAFCRARGLMASVLADEINEKLFDRFGDTVIEFAGDSPAIVEDYAGELSDMLQTENT